MKALRRIIPFLRPYRWIAALMLLTVVLPVAMELVVPRALQVVIDEGIRPGDMAVIVRGAAVMLLAALVGALATLGQGFCRAWLSQGLAYDLRNVLFGHIQSFSLANLDRMHTGELMTRLSSDVDMVRHFASAGLALLLRALLMVFGSLTLVLLTDWRLARVMLVILPAAGLVIWGTMHRARPIFTSVQEKLAALNTIVQENLAGTRVVKAFVRERYEIDRFENDSVAYMQQNIRVGRLMAVAWPVMTVLTNLGIVGVVWWGGLDVITGRLTLGELIAFNNYLMIGMTPLLLLGNVLTAISRAEASAERLLAVLESEPAVQVVAEPHRPTTLAGRIELQQVSFFYDGQHGRPVLDQLDLVVEAGQRVALLGATGAGKSTLLNLIPRFYDVCDGRILIDGVDVRDWELASLRGRIGMVMQRTTLFAGSVRENIAYGRPDATLAQVIDAARAARAHDFICALPAGYETQVEARGANFSGGQKQRLAIARALLIAPAILLLDDCTSAVDVETEIEIERALARLMAGRTTLTVAQRVSSVLNADQIVVLAQGRIAAQGSHRELLASSTLYQEIYRSQLGTVPAPGADPALGTEPAPGTEPAATLLEADA